MMMNRFRASARTRLACIRRFSSEAIWTTARTQELLNRHERIVDCKVVDVGEAWSAKRLGLIVPVVAPKTLNPFSSAFLVADLTADDVHDWLEQATYAGPSLDVQFMTSEELDDAETDLNMRHRRVVMRQLVRSIFNRVDTDGDEQISLKDLVVFLRRHDIEEDSVVRHFHAQDADMSYSLNYQQFKGLIRETKLLVSTGVDGHFESFQVADKLQMLVAREIFFHADERGVGYLTFEDLESVFEAYYVEGNTEKAREVFDHYDTDSDGHICLKEFAELLVHEGVIAVSHN